MVILKDFKEIKEVYLEEKLSEDEIGEGLEPISEIFKVAITNHAWKRINEDFERFCDWDDIEDLILSKSTELINAPHNEDLLLLRNDCKLAIPCIINKIEGFYTIILKSVIRNVYFDNGIEKEKKLRVRRENNIVY